MFFAVLSRHQDPYSAAKYHALMLLERNKAYTLKITQERAEGHGIDAIAY